LAAIQEQQDIEAYNKGMKSIKDNGSISHKKLKKRLGFDLML
jgi:hypothetical protein